MDSDSPLLAETAVSRAFSVAVFGDPNPGDTAGRIQCVAEGAGFAQCEGPVVQGTGLHHVRENFVERADLLNRPLRTRTVGGVGGNG
jgi:hypothetical protein